MIDKKYILPAALCVIMNVQSAYSQITQLQIARNSVGKLQMAIANKKDQNTQMAILGEGIKASESAEKDKKTRKWPETWAIKSYLSSYIAIMDPNESNADKYFDLALNAIDSAKRFDKFEDNSGLIAASNYNINIKKQQKGNSPKLKLSVITKVRRKMCQQKSQVILHSGMYWQTRTESFDGDF